MEKLLREINRLIEKERIIKEEKQKRGEYFNIFEVMHAQNDEENTHSAVIASLLNPKNSHGCRSAFLSLFMEKLSDLLKENVKIPYDEHDLEECNIYVEHYVPGGRIDILIKLSNDYAVIIENKIYAGDQEKQLYRYKQFADNTYGKGNYLIVYLTLDAHSPNENSVKGERGKLEDGIDFHRISYRDFILEWLSACKEKASSAPLVRETITQYYNLIAKMTNRNMEASINEELVNLLANKENISAVFKINEVYKKVLNRVCNTTLLEQIEEIAKELKLRCDYKKDKPIIWYERWRGQFFFSKEEWKHFSIGFEFMGDNLSKLNYGVIYRNPAEKGNLTKIKDEIHKRSGKSNETEWWVFFKQFKDPNWNNNDVFTRLYNGEIKSEIINNINEVLKLLEGIEGL